MANNINIISHPLVNAQLSKLRQSSTTAKEFREVRLIWERAWFIHDMHSRVFIQSACSWVMRRHGLWKRTRFRG